MSLDTEALSHWEATSELIDEIQDKIGELPSIAKLFELLDKSGYLGKSIDRTELSIVYQPYGSDKPEFWLTPNGARKLIEERNTNDENSIPEAEPKYHNFPANLQPIKNVIIDTDPEQKPKVLTTEEIIKHQLPYKNFVIVPMRLSKRKNIGAFILHRKNKNPYSDKHIFTLDKLSNRLAFYIRNNIRRRRNLALQKVHSKLLSIELSGKKPDKEGSNSLPECEILLQFLNLVKDWFTDDEIFLLLKHPLNTKKLVLVNDGTNFVHFEYRAHPELIVTDETLYLGNQRLEREDKNGSKYIPIDASPQIANNSDELTEKGVTSKCKSWAAAPMRLNHETIIGYMVLQNKHTEYAFENGEEEALDALSDFLGLAIAYLRTDRISETLREIREYPLKIDEQHDKPKKEIKKHNKDNLHKLLEITANRLKQLYGIRELVILRYTHSNLGLSESYHSAEGIELAHLVKEPSEKKQQKYKNTVEEEKRFYRFIPTLNKEKKQLKIKRYNNLHEAALDVIIRSNKDNKSDEQDLIKTLIIFDKVSEKNYFISPMRTKTHSAGCLILPAEHIGNYTAISIDDISDILGSKLSAYERQSRYQILTDFGKSISKIEEFREEIIINKAHAFISKAMFTENLFIALYDANTKKIKFPLAYRDGKEWTVKNNFSKTIHGSERLLDQTQLGRTEKIILTGRHILHTTKEKSSKWYNEKNHEDHGKTPLASWVGVPIFSDQGVIGVIAVYHEELDHIFSEYDVFFLQEISFSISGMLRAKELKDANSKIIELENSRRDMLLSRDLTHRIRNAASIILNYCDRIRENTPPDLISINSGSLKKVASSIRPIENQARGLIKSVNNIINNFQGDSSPVDIDDLLKNAIENTIHSIDHNNSRIVFRKSINVEKNISAREPSLYDTICNILNNAVEAVEENSKEKFSRKKEYYIELRAFEEHESIIIEVEDNGEPILVENKDKIFDLNFSTKQGGSGYGLFRAKYYIESIGGTLKLYESTSLKKVLRIELPVDSSNENIFCGES